MKRFLHFPFFYSFCVAALSWSVSTAPAAPATASATAASAASASAAARMDVVDGVAAIVNGDVITFSQVRELVGPRERAIRASMTGSVRDDKIKEARLGALNDLVDRQLILQEFKKKEYNIPDKIISDHIDQIIREEFGGDRQAFTRTLAAQGFTMTKFRDAERDKIIVQAMRFQNVKSEFAVSPTRIDDTYVKSKAQYTTPEQVHLLMIALTKTPGLAPGENDPQKAIAEEVRSKLQSGKPFEQMAKLYSNDPSSANGGDWGWIDNKTLNENLTRIVFRLEPKKISSIIEDGNAYYILQVPEKKNAFTKPIGDVRSEIEKRLTSEERQRMQEQWLVGLRKKAFIKRF